MEIKKIRCLVVDDEVVARRGIIRQLEKINSLEVVGEANCIDAFIEANEKCKPDLIFMDIMLRNKNSMEYLSSVIDLPMLVFVTAYSHHAITGFDLKAIDYLLKPVSDDRLNQCIDKARQQFNVKYQSFGHQPGNLFLKSNGKYYRISPADISFIKSMENYVVVYLETKKLVCKLTMEQMVRLLPPGLFFQVHRSYLVNVKKIDFIEKLNIYIKNEIIPISRDKRKTIYHSLMGVSMNQERECFEME